MYTMLAKTFLQVLAISGSTAAAVTRPTVRTSSGATLVQMLENRNNDALANLRPKLSPEAEIVRPSDAEFVNDTVRWSAWSPPTFDIVFIPATEQDISIALRYMTSHNVQFLTKGGGHGVSLSLATVQNAVMINMEKFDHVAYNSTDNTLAVRGGTRFQSVYDAAYNAGRELTLGSCPCVGATGATMGGGHGRLQGKHGLSADAVVKFRIVLGDGTILEASESENSDLFWAMRGAGHNFGVVVETTFKTFPQENNGLHYNADMVFTKDSLEGIIRTINQLLPVDPALAIDLLILTDPSTLEPIVTLNVVYAGPLEKGQQFSNYFATNSNVSAVGNSTNSMTRLSFSESLVPWNKLNLASSGGSVGPACIDGPATNLYSFNTANFDVPQTLELFESYTSFVKANPLASSSIILWEVFGMQAVLAQPAEKSAVGNRQFADVLGAIEAIYTDDRVAKAADDWARGWRDQLALPSHSGYDKKYFYVNYAHDDESRESIYGYEPWRLQRLRALKRKYDPRGFFNGFHPVGAK